jgi:hypothetical protein
MAKTFYSLEEACAKLQMTEDQVKELVRTAQLREFRDAGKVNYKVEEVDKLAEASGVGGPAASGELVLEPAEDDAASGGSAGGGIDLASSSVGLGSDVLSLEEADLDDTATDTEAAAEKKKDDTVVSSVGVSVFDEDEEELVDVDPLAQTVVSAGAEGLGIEGVGSGSGLLDLTRESDDTSLGADLLDEIYPEEETSEEMGDATRAGLEAAIPETAEGSDAELAEVLPEAETAKDTTAGAAAEAAPQVVRTRVVTEYAPDAVSTGLTGMLAVATLVMCVAGLGAASMMQGVWPAPLGWIYENLWIFGAASLVVALAALGLGFMIGKRSAG